MEYVEVPGSCKVLGSESFAFCSNLREVVLQDGVEVIEKSAFVAAGRKGEALKVVLPDSVRAIGSGAFRDVELDQLKLPANLIEIENSAFKYASWREDSLKCTIPPKVARIGIDGLGNTLTELIFEGTTPPDIEYDIPTVTKVTVPIGYLELYQIAYDGKFNEEIVFVEAAKE